MSEQYASKQASGFNNYIRNVAIVGGTGQQGKHIVSALLKTGKHTITAITRHDSTNTSFETGVKVSKVDYSQPDTLVAALQGQDALIITMAVTAPQDTSLRLIEAAAKAGVPWIVPDEWGCDTTDIEFGKEILIGPPKLAAREQIEKLGVSSWIAVACGFWYEYSLGTMPAMYGFDIQNKTVTFFDGGEQRISTSTWEQVARAVASLLSLKILPADESDSSVTLDRDFRNKFAYVKSFRASQKDMFESLKRVTGTSDGDWKVDYETSKDRVADGTSKLREGDRLGFVKLLYSRTFYPSGEGDFELKYKLANGVLGLPEEDLDECTKGAIERSNVIAAGQKQ